MKWNWIVTSGDKEEVHIILFLFHLHQQINSQAFKSNHFSIEWKKIEMKWKWKINGGWVNSGNIRDWKMKCIWFIHKKTLIFLENVHWWIWFPGVGRSNIFVTTDVWQEKRQFLRFLQIVLGFMLLAF